MAIIFFISFNREINTFGSSDLFNANSKGVLCFSMLRVLIRYILNVYSTAFVFLNVNR